MEVKDMPENNSYNEPDVNETEGNEPEGSGSGANEPDTKTFTKSEVEEIVKKRIARERRRASDQANKTESDRIAELEKKISNMEQAESVRKVRESVAKKNGVPAALLTGNDEETCNTQAKALLEWKQPNSKFPETKKATRRTSTQTTAQQQYNDDMRDFANQLFGQE